MGCTKAHVVLILQHLLEACEEGTREECLTEIRKNLAMVRRGAWKELLAELRA